MQMAGYLSLLATFYVGIAGARDVQRHPMLRFKIVPHATSASITPLLQSSEDHMIPVTSIVAKYSMLRHEARVTCQ